MTEMPGLAGRRVVLNAIEELMAELEAGVEWENDTLVRFLEAAHDLLGVIENSYTNVAKSVPTDPWVIMADLLRGAREYE